MHSKIFFTFTLLVNTFQELPPLPTESNQTQKPTIISFSRAKSSLMNIYIQSKRNLTFYCNCPFNSNKEINVNSCNYSPRVQTNKRSHKLEFEHVVPAYTLGKSLKCWEKPTCKKRNGKKYKGRRCCSKTSKKFRQMEADMHNLFPLVGEVNGDRSNFRFGEIAEEKRNYGQCDFEVLGQVAEPKNSIKGNIARAYFYMSNEYKISISDNYEELLRWWHFSDPPDQWERDRNSLIEEVQGNRNIFIDFPEMVEKMRDF